MTKITCKTCGKRVPKMWAGAHRKGHETPKRKPSKLGLLKLKERGLRRLLRTIRGRD